MKKIDLTYRVTTPAFIGNAEQQAEFRLASFKGLLRFWWRTLQWGRFTNSQALKTEEDLIFGSSDQNVGRSKVRLRLLNPQQMPRPTGAGDVLWKDDPATSSEGNKQRSGAWYLGYGCVNAFYIRANAEKKRPEKKAGQLERPCLMPFTFKVEVRITCDEEKSKTVEHSLAMLGSLGGIGAKSRKGYGSLSLVDWRSENRPTWLDLNNPVSTINNILKETNISRTGNPAWTAFSDDTRIIQIESTERNSTERDLLDSIGREMVYFRSWGNNGKVLGAEPERRFVDDHHLFYEQAKGQPQQEGAVAIAHPERIAFGLPHNYGQKPFEHVYPAIDGNEQESRRASPLFIHLHQPNPLQKPIALVAFFPAEFLPQGTRIKSFGKSVPFDPATIYDPVFEFLDRLEGKGDVGNQIRTHIKGARVL